MKSSKKIKLILNCDAGNEIDDQFAIYYALKSPEIDLLGVVSVQNNRKNGPKSAELYHQEAKKILRLASAKIPCLKGSCQPLDLAKNPEKSFGVKFIIEKILRSKEKILVASTGPCTNIANALLLNPSIARKAVFLWLGGFSNQEEAIRLHHREVNFWGDKQAADVFLDSEIRKIFVPAWGVADSLVLNGQHLEEKLRAKKTAVTDYLADLLNNNWRRHRFNHFLPRRLKKYWVMFDLGAIAAAKDFGIEAVEKKSPNFIKITKINQHKILAQFEKYILS